MRSVLRRGGRNPGSSADPSPFTIVKQHGALFAKGRILGIQFDALFTDDLYLHIGKSALDCAAAIKYRIERRTATSSSLRLRQTRFCYSGERSSAPPGEAGGIQLLGEL